MPNEVLSWLLRNQGWWLLLSGMLLAVALWRWRVRRAARRRVRTQDARARSGEPCEPGGDLAGAVPDALHFELPGLDPAGAGPSPRSAAARPLFARLLLTAAALLLLFGLGLALAWLADRLQDHAPINPLRYEQLSAAACQAPPAARRGIVLFIHGWNGDADATWGRLPDLVCGDPRFAGFTVLSVPYATFMGRQRARIPDVVNWLADQLAERLQPAAGEPLLVVAHSMGGIIARQLHLSRELSRSSPAVTALVEFGVPHNGTVVGDLAQALGLSQRYTRDLARQSSLLADLQYKWQRLPSPPPTVCVASHGDAVVDPDSALLDCAQRKLFNGYGHSELVKPGSRDDPRYDWPFTRLAGVLEGAPR